MLKAFTIEELLNWNEFRLRYEKTLVSQTMAFCAAEDPSRPAKSLKALQDRITEHNIRVISAYYTQIRLARLAELLNLSVEVSHKAMFQFTSDWQILLSCKLMHINILNLLN